MDRGFYIILLAQFLSALADNALFVAAIALLKEAQSPHYQLSLLLHFFTLSYVFLAPFVGAFADAIPKGRVMLICNGIKFGGCLSMFFGMHPLGAYAIVGFGAAAYSPAKYGIVTEYLPHDKLVAANGWLEGSTVSAIILGTVLGGFLVGPNLVSLLTAANVGTQYSGPMLGIIVITVIYLLAAVVNFYIPRIHADHKPSHLNPVYLVGEFWHCVKLLWKDRQGQLTLGVTTLFWGAGATMRLVVLDWGILSLGLTLEQSTRLVAVVAVGTALGAALAGKLIPLKQAFRVLPAGILMGILVICMLWIDTIWVAGVVMFTVGAMSGFFVVPLNAMLQHRGHLLMGAGHSIAVQNFNENMGILLMVGIHALLVKQYSDAAGTPPMTTIIIGFGVLVGVVMTFITLLYRYRVKHGTVEHLEVK